MRILHTSDWHLGRTLHSVDLLEHQAAFLDHLVEVVRSEAIDVVIVAGDVYDRAIPPVRAVELLTEALQRLTALTRVVITPGNHDSATRLGFAAELLTNRLVIRSRVGEVHHPVELPDAEGNRGLLLYPIPYLDPDMSREPLARPGPDGEPELPARSHEAVMDVAMARVHADLSARRKRAAQPVPAAAMAHAFVVGGEPSDSERDIRVGGIDSVPLGAFAPPRAAGGGLDYLALGHLHGPQRVGQEHQPDERAMVARYCGSPLAFSFSEMHHHKSSVVIDIGPGGVGGVELIGTPCPRRLSEARGTLSQLCSPVFTEQIEDWVRVVVTDDVRPRDMFATVRNRFPHALLIVHEPANPPARESAAWISPSADPLDVASEFVQSVAGEIPDEAEKAALRHAYEQVLAANRSA